MMARWMLALALLAQEVPPAAEDDAAERARRALEWLEDGDPELAEVGRRELLRLGEAAVPFIEERLERKGAAALARTLREIDRLGLRDGRPVRLEDLPPPEDPAAAPRGAGERYVQGKYAQAYRLVQKKQYQKAYDLAGALLVLEPRSASSESVRKLRRHCDNMIMQTSLMEARIVQRQAAYVAGDRVDLTMRLRNLHRDAIMIRYDAGPVDSPAGGKAIVQVEVRIPQERGDLVTLTGYDQVALEPEIPIATGAQWEHGFVLDASVGAEYAEHFQVLVVHAWTIPDRIETEGALVTRRIQFEPAVVKRVPRRFAHVLEDPLGALEKALQSAESTRQEVFVAALLLDGEAKEKGMARLVETMKTSERAIGRVWIGHLLGFMADRKLGDDPQKWEEYLRSR